MTSKSSRLVCWHRTISPRGVRQAAVLSIIAQSVCDLSVRPTAGKASDDVLMKAGTERIEQPRNHRDELRFCCGLRVRDRHRTCSQSGAIHTGRRTNDGRRHRQLPGRREFC